MTLENFLKLYKKIDTPIHEFDVWLYIKDELQYTDGFPVPNKYLNYNVVSFIAVGKNLINITIEPPKQMHQLSIFEL